jgi:pSer/pThr/pTyr-binding forkhead associated (FHA) protein
MAAPILFLRGPERHPLGYGWVGVLESPLDHHLATPRELQQRIAAERRGAPFLVYRDGDGAQVLVDLAASGERLTIGRRAANDVVLDWDSEVSRVHATLERAGDDWLVADDGMSRNGTWVGGARVTGRRRLRDGDVIRIGGTAIAFRVPDPESSQATVTAADAAAAESVTPAQRRVLLALCRPYKGGAYAAPASNQQIADELVISVDTVKSTLRALFAVFGVDDLPQNAKRAALAQAAIRTGVVVRRDL